MVGLSPPALYGLIDGWERGAGNPNEQEVRVHQPSVTPEPPPEPFFLSRMDASAAGSRFRYGPCPGFGPSHYAR